MAPGTRPSDMSVIVPKAEQAHWAFPGEEWITGSSNKVLLERDGHAFSLEKSTSLLSNSWNASHEMSGLNYTSHKAALSAQTNLGDRSLNHWNSEDSALNSIPALFQSKLRLSTPDMATVDVGPVPTKKSLPQFDLLTELEWRTVGNILPDDEELFSNVVNDLDVSASVNGMGVNEELDLFSSGGGMELEGDAQDSVGSLKNSSKFFESISVGSTMQNGSTAVAGEHPFGEHPSRTLFVRNINSSVEDTELRALFEQYGDIRTLYTACKHRGFVMISYYDIRAARSAMRALQNKPLRRRKLDIHFSIPKDNPSDKDVNQGTLVVFNLDASVSNDDLRQIFGIYGEVKEIRETPHKRHHKFIEFYDVRAAEAALRALNRSDIAGKRIKLEPSRPGGARRSLMQQLTHELEQEENGLLREFSGSPLTKSAPVGLGNMNNFPFNIPTEACHSPAIGLGLHQKSRLPSNTYQEFSDYLAESLQYSQSLTAVSALKAQMASFNNQKGETTGFKSAASLELRNGGSRATSSSYAHLAGSLPVSDLCSSLNSLHQKQCPQSMWPVPQVRPYGLSGHAVQPTFVSAGPPPNLLSAAACSQHTHVGSAPITSYPLLNRYQGYLKESVDASSILMGSGSFGTAGLGIGSAPVQVLNSSSAQVLGNTTNMGPGAMLSNSLVDCGVYSNLWLMAQARKSLPSHGVHDTTPCPSHGVNDRGRGRKSENPVSQNDKKQYELDIDRILRGEDLRTTLMIKNIPNKYTSKMLLAAIDELHKGTYDFIYLPIDFKNKCNVGYAFINMTEPSRIVPFFQAFNGKRWEKFNSEKVASLAYARIQGKAALIAHFQNSSLMNEDKRCRPILFHSGGPNVGDQEPFPVGTNPRSRSNKSRGNNGTHQGSPMGINIRD